MATLLESLQSLITNPDFLKTILQTGAQVGGAVAGNNAQNQATNQALGVLTDQGNRNTQLAVDLINQTRAEEAPFQEGALQRLKFSERFLPRIEANLSGVDNNRERVRYSRGTWRNPMIGCSVDSLSVALQVQAQHR